MRAIAIEEFGGPEVLKVVELPKPTAGATDLLVEVYATAMNPVDTKVRKGAHGPKAFPLVLGFDVSGVVVGVGGEVEGFGIGDEVFASPSLARQGANAEFVAVDYRTAALKPPGLDHVHAAALPLVTITAWESLHDRAAIRSGETVLIQAGAGGVGHVAVQLAKAAGCRVITTASRPETIDLCRRLGADVVIDHKKEDFAASVMRLTHGKGCPVVFDTVGDPVFDKCLDCVAVNGRLVTIVFNENRRVVPALFRKNATLHMEFMGAATIHGIDVQRQGAIVRRAAEMVGAGTLKPHVGGVVGLDDLAAAHERQQSGSVIGKTVVRVK